jgi:hypothetical protein
MEDINSNKMEPYGYRVIDMDEENLQIYIIRTHDAYSISFYRLSDDCMVDKVVINADVLKEE